MPSFSVKGQLQLLPRVHIFSVLTVENSGAVAVSVFS